MKPFNTVLTESVTELTVQKSRFITYLIPVRTEEAATAQLERIRKHHWDAAHHVPAWVLHEGGQKFSDDGEPGGTAGLPALEALKHAGFENCLAVVVRYFGGIKLGTGGLVRAYGQAVREAISHAECYHVQPYDRLELQSEYTQLGRLQAFLSQEGVTGVETDFSDAVRMAFFVRAERTAALQAALLDLTNGRSEARSSGTVRLAVSGNQAIPYDREES